MDESDDEFFDAPAEISTAEPQSIDQRELETSEQSQYQPPESTTTQASPKQTTTIRNLDTGEIITLEEADSVIPMSPFGSTTHITEPSPQPQPYLQVPTHEKKPGYSFVLTSSMLIAKIPRLNWRFDVETSASQRSSNICVRGSSTLS